MDAGVEATGLKKLYRGVFGRGGTTALRGVDLRVERGTAFGLIGPNGAGKTTFVKAVLGIVQPRGDRTLVELLEHARVARGEEGFSLELALPAETLERWFAGCRARGGSPARDRR